MRDQARAIAATATANSSAAEQISAFARTLAGLFLVRGVAGIGRNAAIHRVCGIDLRIIHRLRPVQARRGSVVVDLRREVDEVRLLLAGGDGECKAETGS